MYRRHPLGKWKVKWLPIKALLFFTEHTKKNFIEDKDIFNKMHLPTFKKLAHFTISKQWPVMKIKILFTKSLTFFNPPWENLVFSQEHQSRHSAATATLLLQFKKGNEKLKLPTASDKGV